MRTIHIDKISFGPPLRGYILYTSKQGCYGSLLLLPHIFEDYIDNLIVSAISVAYV